MRVALKLIIYLVAVIALVAFGFAAWQTYEEGRSQKDELDERSLSLSGALLPVVEPLLAGRSFDELKKAVDVFAEKENISGIAIYAADGRPRVVSKWLEERLDHLILSPNDHSGEFVDLNNHLTYAYSIRLFKDKPQPYALTLFYDTGFIYYEVKEIWVNHFIRLLVQILLVSLSMLLILYLNVLTPIKKMTEWIKRVRLGESSTHMNPHAEKLLGPLAHEVSQMAKSLEIARIAAEHEARLRHSSESIWTPERLKEFIRIKLGPRPLFVVSNREPYRHIQKGKNIECIVPASGLVTAIEPVLKACGGTWIAQGDGDADRLTVDANDRLRVPPDEPQYTLRRVWIGKEEEEGFYYGFSNEGLWPLCHVAHTRPIFREEDWRDYEKVNQKFAQAVLQEIENVEAPCVLVQDYHFALLPQYVKSQRPDARVTLFWHIPWPNPESFGICPWQKDLLRGMLGSDIIGFHTQYHCNNFLETVDRFLESRIDYERFAVHREGQTTWVKPFPISIAFLGDTRPVGEESVPPISKERLLRSYGISAQWMGVGVDRLDYTKGILERFKSIELFLEKNPLYQGRFTFVELAAPSRSLIPRYQEFCTAVEKEVERINARFKSKSWKAILFLKKHHSHEEILPFYKAADLCLVTSLHDGMNLVAKEYVMARDDEKGTLILSQFTGAARELTQAILVNPYDIAQTASAIESALNMTLADQTERMHEMREILKERNIYRWAADLVGELAQVRLANGAKSQLVGASHPL